GNIGRRPTGARARKVAPRNAPQAEPNPAEEKPPRPATTVAARGGRRSAALVQQMSAVRKRTEQLLQRNQQLRQELSSLCLASASIRVRASRVVSLARLASPAGEIEVHRAA